MDGGDVAAAADGFRSAADAADAAPDIFSLDARLAFRQRQACADLRLSQFARAESLFKALLQRRRALNGPNHPETLRIQVNLAQIELAQGQAAAAIPVLDRIDPQFVAIFGSFHRRTLQLLIVRAEAFSQMQRYDAAGSDLQTAYRAEVAAKGADNFQALGTLSDLATTDCMADHFDRGLQYAHAAANLALARFGGIRS